MPESEYRVGDWLFLPRQIRLIDPARGRDVALTPRAARLLACLIAQPGVVRSHAELALACQLAADGHALTQAVSELRQALQDGCHAAPVYIQTLPKRGYRLAVPVTVVAAGSTGRLRERWLLFAALAATFVAIVAMLWLLHVQGAIAPKRLALPDTQQVTVAFEQEVDERLNAQLVGLGSLATYTLARYTPYEVVQVPDLSKLSSRLNSARHLRLRVVRVGQMPQLHARLIHRARAQILLDKHYPFELHAATMTALAADLLRALRQPLPAELPGADTADDLVATERFFLGHYRFFKADPVSLREAVSLLGQVHASYPTRPEVLAMLGICQLALGDLAGEAGASHWRAAADATMTTLAGLSASPYYTHPLVPEAHALYALYQGRPQQGLALVDTVLRERETWRAQVIRGKLAELAGQLDMAADAYARAWLLSPTPVTLDWIGQLAFRTDLAAVAPGLAEQLLRQQQRA